MWLASAKPDAAMAPASAFHEPTVVALTDTHLGRQTPGVPP
jgi:hypothetical protein